MKHISMPNYVIITSAYNEEEYIKKTINSVIKQNVKPIKWLIISDGSTDNTNKIISMYESQYDWIESLILTNKIKRNFASKAYAINIGYKKIKEIDFEYICILDADISFKKDYFNKLLNKFTNCRELGCAGTDYTEGKYHSSKNSYINKFHVNGACQLFRRKCWEEIGGYLPVKGGGIDWIAIMNARMKGWSTKSFSDSVFVHHRPIGTAETNSIGSRFRYGIKDYYLGNHPVWEIFRIIHNMKSKPYILGGIALLCGYLSGWFKNIQRPIAKELIDFHQAEQKKRLREIILSMTKFGGKNI